MNVQVYAFNESIALSTAAVEWSPKFWATIVERALGSPPHEEKGKASAKFWGGY